MSFFTSLRFYRPCSPPPITADDLARFIIAIRDSGILHDAGVQALNVKFGESIDHDFKGAIWEEETVPGVFDIREIEWDLDILDPAGLQAIIDALASNDRRVYRASVMLGSPIDEVLRPITRTGSPENEVDYCPDTLSVELGPIGISHMGCEQPWCVGWIAVDISGPGYLFPWTFQEAYDRLDSSEAIQRITGVCRSFWPVEPARPESEIVGQRKQAGDLWPYAELDKPWDWYWGIAESG